MGCTCWVPADKDVVGRVPMASRLLPGIGREEEVMEPEDAAQIVGHASMIGDLLEDAHPRVVMDGASYVADGDVEEVAGVITLVVAQILQSWLDAGSERDVTMEELGPAIEAHVRGWSV